MQPQLLGWRHLVNWTRTLSVGGLVIGLPLLCMALLNGNSLMTGAAEGTPYNIFATGFPAVGAGISLITSLVSSWFATGRISATDSAVQEAFKNLAILALDSPTAAHLLQQLKQQIAPAVLDKAIGLLRPAGDAETLLTPAEYMLLLEKSIRQEVSKSCIK